MLDLYVLDNCPYCKKVMDYAEENDIKYNKKEISNPDNHNDLIKCGGKEQVPFLVDGNICMYESGDIIKYLEQKKEEL